MSDITERKRAEGLVRQSEERYRSLVDTARDAIFTIAADGTFTSLNPATETIGGLTRADWIGRSFEPMVHPDDRRLAEEMFQRVLSGKPVPVHELRGHPTLPRPAVLEMTLTAQKNEAGIIIGVQGIGRDITERKQAEAALRDSEEKFRQLADNITDVFWISSPDLSTILYLSPGYELIWGSSRESLQANPHQWLEAVLPEERQRVAAVFATLRDQETAVSVEYQITRPDGTVRWIHDRGFQVRDAAGKVVRLAGIASDITERKRAALELAEHKENEARVRLELEHEHALNRIKSHFVSLVSHEFRTPLSVISMGAFMLRDYGEGMSGEERAEEIQQIQLAVGRMTGMMEDFLVHEKIQCGKLACHPVRMNLEAFCQGLIPEVANHFQPARLVELSLEPAAREAFLDEKILRHILGNLLSNAVKYSDAGQPVKLEVKRVTGQAWSPESPETPTEDHLQLTVSDTGIGIPAADLAKIYDTFHRAANVGNRPGTGMGLAIVKQFVDLHRGASSGWRARKGRAPRSGCGCQSARSARARQKAEGGND